MYNISECVLHRSTGKKSIVVGSNLSPYEPSLDPYHRKEIYPKNGFDYLIMFKNEDGIENEYKGLISVMEKDISRID